MLKRKLQGYKHGSLDFSRFAVRIKNAIDNSKTYRTAVSEIMTDFGTNFMDIVTVMGY